MTTPIRDLLARNGLELTPSEAKIVQILLQDYPIAGLGTANRLAKRAGVSDPTVIRLVTKLGFDGFPAFQARLLEELDASLRSPLMMMEAKRPAPKGKRDVAQAYMHSAATATQAAAGMMVAQTCDRAVRLIMEARGRVILVGGRFSRYVAGMLAGYLAQFRSGVVPVSVLTPETFDILVDLDSRDVLIVFDYRRYQSDVIRFATQAAERGVSIVLFTDPFRSPIEAHAKAVFIATGEVGSPYDSMAPAVAQIEAVVACIVAQRTSEHDDRVNRIERVRTDNAVTIESAESARAGKAKTARPRRKTA